MFWKTKRRVMITSRKVSQYLSSIIVDEYWLFIFCVVIDFIG